MEKSGPNRILHRKYEEVNKAISTFRQSMAIPLGKFSEIEVDTLKSGQIQKFEYCSELLWKLIKSFLKTRKGVDAQGPKDVVRQFAKFKYLVEGDIVLFLEMIDDRNRVAHEYKERIMKEIYPKLDAYLALLEKSINALSAEV